MKTIKRRLLSVLMVMAIVCTLIPTALAAGALYIAPGGSQTVTTNVGGAFPQSFLTTWSSSNSSLVSVSGWGNQATISVSPNAPAGTVATITAKGVSYSTNPWYDVPTETWTVYVSGNVSSGQNAGISASSLTLSTGTSNNSGSLYVYPGNYSTIYSVSWQSSNPYVAYVYGSGQSATVYAADSGSANIVATVSGYTSYGVSFTETLSCTVTVNGGAISLPSTAQVALNVPYSLTATLTGAAAGKTVSWSVDDPSTVTLNYSGNTATITGKEIGTATVTASVEVNGVAQKAQCKVTVGNGTLVLSSNAKTMSLNGDDSLYVVSLNGETTIPQGVAINWSSNRSDVVSFLNSGSVGTTTGSSVSLYAKAPGQATITATAMQNGVEIAKATCLVTVASIQAKATVYSTENGFTLGSTNLKTPTSVVSQIASALSGYTGYGALQYVTFSNVTSTYGSLNASVNTPYYYSTYGGTGYYGNLSAITFTPSTTAVGSAVFNFTAYVSNGVTTNPTGYPGTLTITVEKGSAGIDVLYSTTVGQSVKVNAQDFQSFWTKNVSSLGSLRYVVFGAATGSVGQLYYTSGTQNYAVGSQQFYYSPAAGQNALSGVYFAPTAYGTTRTGTLAVPFTAYGTSNYNTTSMTSASGTLYVCVTNGAVQDVTYQANTNGVTLNPADFQAVYRQATGTAAANPTVYIQFLNVPTYGALYYNYKSGIFGGTGTKLTSANVGTMVFSNTTATVYGINDLTYIPGSGNLTDTVRYVVYSTNGGTPLYVGEIVFGAVSVAPIKYYATGSGTAAFKASDFFNADTGLITAQYISFGKPSSGTLYQNYSNGRGTAVTTADRFSYYGTGTNASINNVTYVPVSGYTGVVTIPYTGYTATGGQISGNVKVYVVAKPFTDVPSTHWSYEYVMELVASGIVGGVTPTTFYPNSELKYGEALKLIMLAAGYSEQAKTGSHWASGYLTRAYRDGLVSSANIDLNAVIDRYTMATIAAKALKLSPVSNITSPFVDTKDPYVLALYKAGIVEGTTINGLTYYKGDSAFVRSEVCAIICRMNDYTLSK